MKKIALIGQPNVGKSSLFNRIAKKRIAIVSEQSGTTRDIRKHIVDIFDKKGDFIASEVLAKEIVTENGQGYTKDWKINGEDVTLTVEKIK